MDPSFTQYTSTTPYPHPHPSSPDTFTDPFNTSHPLNPYILSSRPSSSHQLGQVPRQCEVHMNSFQHGSSQDSNFRSSSHQMLQRAKTTLPQTLMYILCYCCRANGLLAKFPSRAKRIDVISRFVFPLIFAIFNLAYWLYYLLAKNNFTGSKV